MISLSEYLEKPQSHASHSVSRSDLEGLDSPEIPLELQSVAVDQVSVETVNRIVLLSDPKSPGADRFRYLRMRLKELRGHVKLKTLIITSALPQDGKSTVAQNLAMALAERGRRRVLLIEADLHCPTITDSLGTARSSGLAECLEQNLAPLAAIRRLEPLQWYLLPAGQPVGNPTELLQSSAFANLVEKVSPYFEWVLIDTPPVAPLSDALLAAKCADASVLVVRADQTPKTAVDDALSLLGPQHVAGIIFNGAEGLNHLYSKYSGYYGRK